MDKKYKIEELKDKIERADSIIIGAGAGLSASAGFEYKGKRFHENFHDFEMIYGFGDMYSGGFYPYETLEEYWAYWSRYIYINRYTDPPKPVYENLYNIVKNKDHFIITTNVDHCFQKAGFSKERLFYTQGDYGLWQCSKPCHNETYDNRESVMKMIREQKNMKIPSELVPYCPKCGRPMGMNLRADNTFVEDKGWHAACERYEEYLKRHKRDKVLFIELGCGMNTPGIIKFPFWKYVYEWKNAEYVCINFGEAYAPEEIKDKSLCINDDIGEVLIKLTDIYFG